jgi:hypothetical protein
MLVLQARCVPSHNRRPWHENDDDLARCGPRCERLLCAKLSRFDPNTGGDVDPRAFDPHSKERGYMPEWSVNSDTKRNCGTPW